MTRKGKVNWEEHCCNMGSDLSEIVEIVREKTHVPKVLMDLRSPQPAEFILSQVWAGGLRDAALARDPGEREQALDWVKGVVTRLGSPKVVSLLDLLVAITGSWNIEPEVRPWPQQG